MLTAIIHGFLLALGLILPLGAQNVFVFNQGASQPKLRGTIPVIVTAACCDTLLILLAVLGVSVVVFTIPALQTAIFIVGLAFLLYMGWSIWKSKPAGLDRREAAMSPKKQMMFAMSVSLLNPHAILDTIGVIGTSSLGYTGLDKLLFTISTIAVSWIWFFALAIAGKMVGKVDSGGRLLIVINKLSALVIWGVAVYIALKLFKLI
ncbi:LysE family transporter [Paenibacillus sp. VCA1]|uniref:LysE/ArgO family amino acid transporter n=1 Tax=Paenibacillus sp. VCA1 TaxID=3039148 RepID=UPI0028711B02|nr:LysE family transporter [Paenibacillus sp. VCA1]MDR9856273.1 LysE family transporter [Paenibacillus sp. VCA1]